MTDRYYVEAWLRPPIEFCSAFTCTLVTLLLVWRPEVLMLAPSMGWLAALLPALLGFWRFRQGLQVVRYQRHLKRLPEYTLRNTKVPVSTRWYFLGRGFEWTQRHTQRLWDTRSGENVLTLPLERGFPYVASSDDGRRLATSAGGYVRVWTLDLDELLTIARNRLSRSLSAAECVTFHFEDCPVSP